MAEVDLGTAQGKIEIDSSGAKREVDSLDRSIDGMTKNSQANMQALSKSLLIIGSAAVVGFGYAIKQAADFQQTMSGVQAVTGANESQMEKLRKKALQLGADTVFSAGDAAGAMEELAKSGIKVDDILNGAADAAVNLAAAGGIDIPQAAQIASNAMNAFGLSAEQMPHVADLIAGAANASAIDVNEFGMSLAQAGATANLIGLSFDDLSVAIAAMGNAGVRGSDAGTSLKTFLQNLQPVTEKQVTLFEKLGLSIEDNATKMNPLGNAFFDATGKIKSMSEIAGILNGALDGMSDAQKTATLETIFGTDAIRAAAVIANTGAEGMDALAGSMSQMTAADVAAVRLDNVKGSIEQLKGSVDTFIISAALPLLDFFQQGFDMATDFTNKLNELPDNVKAIILAVIGAAGAILAIVGAMGLFMHAAGPAIAAIKLLTLAFEKNALALLTNPWVLLAVAIAALVVGIIYAYKHSERFREIVDAVVEKIKEFGRVVVEWFQEKALPAIKAFARFFIEEMLPRIKDFVEGAIGVFKAVVSFFTDVLVPGVRTAWDAVFNIVSAFVNWFNENVVSTINAAVELIIAIFGRIEQFVRTFIVPQLEFLFNLLAPIVTTVFNIIAKVIGVVLDTITTIISVFINFVQKAWALFGDNIIAAVMMIFNTIKAFIEVILGVVRGIIQFVTGLITLDWDKTWEGIKTIFTSVWDFIKTYVQIALDAIKLVIETVIDTIKLILSTAWDIIKGAASLAWDGIKLAITAPIELVAGILQGVWDAVTGAAASAWGIIKTVASTIWETIAASIMLPINIAKKLLGEVWDDIKSTASTAWNAVKNVIEPIVNAIVAIIQKIIDIAHDAIDAVKSIPKKIGGLLPSTSGNDVPFVPFLARGAIVTRQTLAMIGEGGPEAVIPLDDPSRALQLLQASGLMALVNSGGGGAAPAAAAPSSSGPGEVVHIDHASFYDSVDVQTLLTQAEFALQGGRF